MLNFFRKTFWYSTALLMSLLASRNSLAVPYCAPAALVFQKVEYCEENDFFVEAGENCLTKLDQEVLAMQKKLAVNFSEYDKASVTAQDSKFRNSGNDLQKTNDTLKFLLSEAYRARADFQLYLKTIIYPGNPSADVLARNGLADFLGDLWCYKDNKEALTNQLASLNKKIAELERTRAQTQALASRTSTGLQHLDIDSSSPPTGVTRKTSGVGSAVPVVKGKSPQGQSTITGSVKKVELK